MYDKLFAKVALPVRPETAADGAGLQLIEAPEEVAIVRDAFFGGYAEDFLADLGFDMVEESPETGSGKAKRA